MDSNDLDVVFRFPRAWSSSSASTARISSIGRGGRCCGCSVAATGRKSDCNFWRIAFMIVWHMVDKWVGVLGACPMLPEFVNHPFSCDIFPRDLLVKQATVSDGSECVWDPNFLRYANVCEECTVFSALVRRASTDECQVLFAPLPKSIGDPIS